MNEWCWGSVAILVGILLWAFISDNVLHPLVLFLTALLFNVTGLPLVNFWAEATGLNYRYWGIISLDTFNYAILLSLLAAIGYAIGFAIGTFVHSKSRASLIVVPESMQRRFYHVAKVGLLAVDLLCLYLVTTADITKGYGVAQWANIGVFSIGTMRGFIIPALSTYYLAMMIYRKKSKGLRDSLLILSIVLQALLAIQTGGRKVSILALLGLGMLWHLYNRVTDVRRSVLANVLRTLYLLLGLVSIVLFNFLTVAMRQEGLGLSSFVSILGGLDASMRDIIWGIVTSMGNLGLLTQVLRIIPSLEPFRLGQTYIIAMISIFFPSSIMGIRLADNPVIWFHEVYYPTVTNMGYDFSGVAEAYMNFGAYGPFIVFLILGLGVGYLYSLARHDIKYGALGVALYPIMVVESILYIRTDFDNVLTPFFYFSIYVVFIYLLASHGRIIILHRKGKVHNEGQESSNSDKYPHPI